jgi:hypothetical protein
MLQHASALGDIRVSLPVAIATGEQQVLVLLLTRHKHAIRGTYGRAIREL